MDQITTLPISMNKNKIPKHNVAQLNNYNITRENIDEFLIEQDFACAICREYFKNTPNIDHDHETDFVRGLLCRRCNTGIGFFKDSVRLLSGAIVYLETAKRKYELQLPDKIISNMPIVLVVNNIADDTLTNKVISIDEALNLNINKDSLYKVCLDELEFFTDKKQIAIRKLSNECREVLGRLKTS